MAAAETIDGRAKLIRVNQVESWDSIDPQWWKIYMRADQNVLCACGRPLWQHGKPLPERCPTMIQDCAGDWWKT